MRQHDRPSGLSRYRRGQPGLVAPLPPRGQAGAPRSGPPAEPDVPDEALARQCLRAGLAFAKASYWRDAGAVLSKAMAAAVAGLKGEVVAALKRWRCARTRQRRTWRSPCCPRTATSPKSARSERGCCLTSDRITLTTGMKASTVQFGTSPLSRIRSRVALKKHDSRRAAIRPSEVTCFVSKTADVCSPAAKRLLPDP